jgi:ATP-binding cassette subfamily C protein
VIAHRLSTILECDRIVVLEKGNIVEEGSYQELMQKEGVFYKYAKRQLI